jgi:hypothetical protein
MHCQRKKNHKKYSSSSSSSSSDSSVISICKHGRRGPCGKRGHRGEKGCQGEVGPIGQTGPQGVTGQNGQNGQNGLDGVSTNMLGAYAYVYALIPQTVAISAPILFDTNGPLSNINHTPSSSIISVVYAGVYYVTFSVSGTEPNQFDIFVNGVQTLSSIYGSGAGTQQNTGSVILNLNGADTLTLVNNASPAAVTLASLVGGTNTNVTASVTILKIA